MLNNVHCHSGSSSFVRTAAMLTCLVGLAVETRGARADQIFELCKPNQVMSFSSRVHVRCDKPVPILGGTKAISYFAIGTSADPRLVNRAMALGVSAQVNGKALVILFDPADESGASFGCQANDCRTIVAIGLEQ
jgi:hypothetical protein